MSNITDLQDALETKTLTLVILTIVTMGTYPIMWMYLNTEKIEKITGKAIANSKYIINIACCMGLSSIVASLASLRGSATLPIMCYLLTLTGNALIIAWAFKAKSAIEEYALTQHKIDLKINVFYVFFFNLAYINYCINSLPELQRKQQILTGTAKPET